MHQTFPQPPPKLHRYLIGSTWVRIAASLLTILLLALTIMPPGLRPQTDLPHNLEHFASFALAGLLWSLGFPRRVFWWLSAAIAFTAALELLQLIVPGRHARVADFLMDAAGSCAGILIGFVLALRSDTGRSAC